LKSELRFSWVSVGVRRELDGVVRVSDSGLDVASERVDRHEHLSEDDSPTAACIFAVLDRASGGGDPEAVQAVGN
jgi:hypothetical protein